MSKPGLGDVAIFIACGALSLYFQSSGATVAACIFSAAFGAKGAWLWCRAENLSR